ncbi:MAG TPA: site-2 protease family protein [Acidimicrobiales bacterium]
MSETELIPPTPDGPIAADQEPEGDIAGVLGLVGLAGAFIALGLFGGWPILAVVVSLVVMIFMHELGHYITAKKAGMKVTEFFIGFGPRIWSFQRGETEYGIKAIPAGAYVRIIGMNSLEEVDPADESRTYRQKSYPRRMSVAVAGSTMHFLMALVLAFVSLLAFGAITENSARNWTVDALSTPEDIAQQHPNEQFSESFQQLLDEGETPSTIAGLESGDRIVSADGVEFDDYIDFREFIRSHPGESVTLVIERGDETIQAPLPIGAVGTGEAATGVIGLAAAEPRERFGVLPAARGSVEEVGTLMADSVSAIGHFFTPSGLSSFADAVFSPADEEEPATSGSTAASSSSSDEDGRIISIVGAARLGAQATDANGLVALFQIMIVLNVFIGLFNLIPLLPFDGGHVAIGTYERIREIGHPGRRYQANLTRMLPVAYAVVLFMVTIGTMALYADIANPIDFPG